MTPRCSSGVSSRQRRSMAQVSGDGLHSLLHRIGHDLAIGRNDEVFIHQLVDQMRNRTGAVVVAIEVAVEELEEDPLRPFVIAWIGRIDLPVPVIGKPHHPELPAEVFDVLCDELAGMAVVLDGVLLGRQAEGVPPHGMQHVEAAHALIARDDVGGGVVLDVSHVKPGAAGVGEHVEQVALGHAAGVFGARARKVLSDCQCCCHFFSIAVKL